MSPVHGDPAGNMKTADAMLASLSREAGLHVLLLPEMAFSGYCFDDVAAVRGVLEDDRGATVEWCKRHAVRLQCTVLCGYPRSVVLDDDDDAAEQPDKNNDDDDERRRGEGAGAGGGERGGGGQGDDPQMTSAPAGISATAMNDTPGVAKEEEGEQVKQKQKKNIENENKNKKEQLYNALVVVGPDGTVLAHYHKSFLYCIDKTWASEGGGFISVPIPFVTRGDGGGDGDGGGGGGEGVEEIVLASLGICMDINPREFKAPWWDSSGAPGGGGKGGGTGRLAHTDPGILVSCTHSYAFIRAHHPSRRRVSQNGKELRLLKHPRRIFFFFVVDSRGGRRE